MVDEIHLVYMLYCLNAILAILIVPTRIIVLENIRLAGA